MSDLRPGGEAHQSARRLSLRQSGDAGPRRGSVVTSAKSPHSNTHHGGVANSSSNNGSASPTASDSATGGGLRRSSGVLRRSSLPIAPPPTDSRVADPHSRAEDDDEDTEEEPPVTLYRTDVRPFSHPQPVFVRVRKGSSAPRPSQERDNAQTDGTQDPPVMLGRSDSARDGSADVDRRLPYSSPPLLPPSPSSRHDAEDIGDRGTDGDTRDVVRGLQSAVAAPTSSARGATLFHHNSLFEEALKVQPLQPPAQSQQAKRPADAVLQVDAASCVAAERVGEDLSSESDRATYVSESLPFSHSASLTPRGSPPARHVQPSRALPVPSTRTTPAVSTGGLPTNQFNAVEPPPVSVSATDSLSSNQDRHCENDATAVPVSASSSRASSAPRTKEAATCEIVDGGGRCHSSDVESACESDVMDLNAAPRASSSAASPQQEPETGNTTTQTTPSPLCPTPSALNTPHAMDDAANGCKSHASPAAAATAEAPVSTPPTSASGGKSISRETAPHMPTSFAQRFAIESSDDSTVTSDESADADSLVHAALLEEAVRQAAPPVLTGTAAAPPPPSSGQGPDNRRESVGAVSSASPVPPHSSSPLSSAAPVDRASFEPLVSAFPESHSPSNDHTKEQPHTHAQQSASSGEAEQSTSGTSPSQAAEEENILQGEKEPDSSAARPEEPNTSTVNTRNANKSGEDETALTPHRPNQTSTEEHTQRRLPTEATSTPTVGNADGNEGGGDFSGSPMHTSSSSSSSAGSSSSAVGHPDSAPPTPPPLSQKVDTAAPTDQVRSSEVAVSPPQPQTIKSASSHSSPSVDGAADDERVPRTQITDLQPPADTLLSEKLSADQGAENSSQDQDEHIPKPPVAKADAEVLLDSSRRDSTAGATAAAHIPSGDTEHPCPEGASAARATRLDESSNSTSSSGNAHYTPTAVTAGLLPASSERRVASPNAEVPPQPLPTNRFAKQFLIRDSDSDDAEDEDPVLTHPAGAAHTEAAPEPMQRSLDASRLRTEGEESESESEFLPVVITGIGGASSPPCSDSSPLHKVKSVSFAAEPEALRARHHTPHRGSASPTTDWSSPTMPEQPLLSECIDDPDQVLFQLATYPAQTTAASFGVASGYASADVAVDASSEDQVDDDGDGNLLAATEDDLLPTALAAPLPQVEVNAEYPIEGEASVTGACEDHESHSESAVVQPNTPTSGVLTGANNNDQPEDFRHEADTADSNSSRISRSSLASSSSSLQSAGVGTSVSSEALASMLRRQQAQQLSGQRPDNATLLVSSTTASPARDAVSVAARDSAPQPPDPDGTADGTYTSQSLAGDGADLLPGDDGEPQAAAPAPPLKNDLEEEPRQRAKRKELAAIELDRRMRLLEEEQQEFQVIQMADTDTRMQMPLTALLSKSLSGKPPLTPRTSSAGVDSAAVTAAEAATPHSAARAVVQPASPRPLLSPAMSSESGGKSFDSSSCDDAAPHDDDAAEDSTFGPAFTQRAADIAAAAGRRSHIEAQERAARSSLVAEERQQNRRVRQALADRDAGATASASDMPQSGRGIPTYEEVQVRRLFSQCRDALLSEEKSQRKEISDAESDVWDAQLTRFRVGVGILVRRSESRARRQKLRAARQVDNLTDEERASRETVIDEEAADRAEIVEQLRMSSTLHSPRAVLDSLLAAAVASTVGADRPSVIAESSLHRPNASIPAEERIDDSYVYPNDDLFIYSSGDDDAVLEEPARPPPYRSSGTGFGDALQEETRNEESEEQSEEEEQDEDGEDVTVDETEEGCEDEDDDGGTSHEWFEWDPTSNSTLAGNKDRDSGAAALRTHTTTSSPSPQIHSGTMLTASSAEGAGDASTTQNSDTAGMLQHSGIAQHSEATNDTSVSAVERSPTLLATPGAAIDPRVLLDSLRKRHLIASNSPLPLTSAGGTPSAAARTPRTVHGTAPGAGAPATATSVSDPLESPIRPPSSNYSRYSVNPATTLFSLQVRNPSAARPDRSPRLQQQRHHTLAGSRVRSPFLTRHSVPCSLPVAKTLWWAQHPEHSEEEKRDKNQHTYAGIHERHLQHAGASTPRHVSSPARRGGASGDDLIYGADPRRPYSRRVSPRKFELPPDTVSTSRQSPPRRAAADTSGSDELRRSERSSPPASRSGAPECCGEPELRSPSRVRFNEPPPTDRFPSRKSSPSREAASPPHHLQPTACSLRHSMERQLVSMLTANASSVSSAVAPPRGTACSRSWRDLPGGSVITRSSTRGAPAATQSARKPSPMMAGPTYSELSKATPRPKAQRPRRAPAHPSPPRGHTTHIECGRQCPGELSDETADGMDLPLHHAPAGFRTPRQLSASAVAAAASVSHNCSYSSQAAPRRRGGSSNIARAGTTRTSSPYQQYNQSNNSFNESGDELDVSYGEDYYNPRVFVDEFWRKKRQQTIERVSADNSLL